jgi:uncharacterized cupredoxin-like copper-binding protein
MKTKHFALMLTLCSAAMAAGAAEGPQKVNVSLSDHTITLDVGTVKPGKVVFEITSGSDSKFEHEFVVLRSELDSASLPVKEGKVDEGKLRNVGEVEGIKPGKTKRLSLNLKEGHYSVICNVTGHYEMGMNSTLVVMK